MTSPDSALQTTAAPLAATDTWPDQNAASYLVIAVGAQASTAAAARRHTEAAEAIGPTTLLVLDDVDAPVDAAALGEALAAARTGVRIIVVGGRYDVLQAIARTRAAGAIPAEISADMTHQVDLPIYCAHCRARHRVVADPGGRVGCPGCALLLEVHDHLAGVLGCYLASDSGEVAPRAPGPDPRDGHALAGAVR